MSSALSSGQADPQPTSEPAPTAYEIFQALISTVHAMVRFGNTRLGLCHSQGKSLGKLSEPRLRVLIAVAEAGSLRMGDLAAQLGVKARTVTDLADGLEKDGLVVRRPDPSDRRATRLEPTPNLRQQWEQLRGQYDEIGEEVLSPLDAAERQHLLDLLTRLNAGPLHSAKAGRSPTR